MPSICLHCLISGRVQGVFFRRAAYQQGRARGVQGWVRNLPDGRVEAVLCGERDEVEKMRDWLWEGPKASQVTAVESTEIRCESFKNFEVR